MTDLRAALALYDQQMRRVPPPIAGCRCEREGPIVRLVGAVNQVIFSDLDETNAREVVAAQAAYFRQASVPVEWKHFGHDRPLDLPEILAAEGFQPEEPETVVIFDLRQGVPGIPPGEGIEVRRLTDESELLDAATVTGAAFGPREDPVFQVDFATILRDPDQALFVAYVDGVPASAGRVDMPPGRSFAGLWGGGTVPKYRHRGLYRALVMARAELARSRGFRFLTVDAQESSRPILERLGFVPLTTTRPWVLRPDARPGPVP